jgi:hypothetical protein
MKETGLVTVQQVIWGYINKMIGQSSYPEYSNAYSQNFQLPIESSP